MRLGAQQVKVRSEGQKSEPKDHDSLYLAFQPGNMFAKAAGCDTKGTEGGGRNDADAHVEHLWTRLQNIFGAKGRNVIVLKPASTLRNADHPGQTPIPVLHTRSALGVLKIAVEDEDASVGFAEVDAVKRLVLRQGSGPNSCGRFFYAAVDGSNALFSLFPGEQALRGGMTDRERDLGHKRKLILVEQSAERPEGSFVSVFYKGSWYAIDDDDLISKRNLALIAQINTI